MPYLLDTDWVIDLLDAHPDAISLLASLVPDGVSLSIITYLEAFQGTVRAADPGAAQAKLEAFITTIPVLPLSFEVARRCARLRHTLRQQGKRVNPRALDLIIAATALEHGLTLVTRNVADYQDIPNLKVHPPGSGGTGTR